MTCLLLRNSRAKPDTARRDKLPRLLVGLRAPAELLRFARLARERVPL